jgi:hypothetical protein
MRWENIQRTLRYKLGELFPQEQSIRSIVRDVDSTLQRFVVWNGNAVDCWSGILEQVRIRHFELDLIEAALMAYPQDEVLQKAKDDFKTLTPQATLTVTSSPASVPPQPTQKPAQPLRTQNNKLANGTGPIEVFISYSEDDERFKKQLETHLSLLRREKLINPWHIQQTMVGDAPGRHEQEIAEHIDSAQIVLLLMSPSFIASDQLYENEMTRAIERQKAGAPVRVIPIAVRHIAPSDPDRTPDFQKIQGLPRNGRPIEAWRSADEAWSLIAQEIRQVCKDLRKSTEKH